MLLKKIRSDNNKLCQKRIIIFKLFKQRSELCAVFFRIYFLSFYISIFQKSSPKTFYKKVLYQYVANVQKNTNTAVWQICQLSWCRRELPRFEKFLQVSSVVKYFSQYCLPPLSKQPLIWNYSVFFPAHIFLRLLNYSRKYHKTLQIGKILNRT